MDEDVVTKEDMEDALSYHRRKTEDGEQEHFYGTLNYILDKFLSVAIKDYDN